jgi:TPR repeat protein
LMDGTGVKPRDEARGSALLRGSAEAGDPAAMSAYALLCKTGARGVKRDMRACLAWLRKAADAGLPTAMYNLGVELRDLPAGAAAAALDLPARSDVEGEANRLFRAAADLGHISAMTNLGTRLLHGKGIAADPSAAVDLWRAAAARGNVTALRNLALCFEQGLGGLEVSQSRARSLRAKADKLESR